MGNAEWARVFLKPSPVACLEKGLILTSEGKQDALLLTGLFLCFCGKLFLAVHPTFERETKVERAVDAPLL